MGTTGPPAVRTPGETEPALAEALEGRPLKAGRQLLGGCSEHTETIRMGHLSASFYVLSHWSKAPSYRKLPHIAAQEPAAEVRMRHPSCQHNSSWGSLTTRWAGAAAVSSARDPSPLQTARAHTTVRVLDMSVCVQAIQNAFCTWSLCNCEKPVKGTVSSRILA